jgi:hypothetical protein
VRGPVGHDTHERDGRRAAAHDHHPLAGEVEVLRPAGAAGGRLPPNRSMPGTTPKIHILPSDIAPMSEDDEWRAFHAPAILIALGGTNTVKAPNRPQPPQTSPRRLHYWPLAR